MYSALSPHAIGVRAQNLQQAIAAAKEGGFQGVECNIREVADLIDAHGVEHVRQLFEKAGLKPAGWGMPGQWRGNDEEFRGLLADLPRLASAAAAIGALRSYTWILPASDELPYEENRSWHLSRIAPVAELLAPHGVHFGLEFVGPKTMRDGKRYPFIYTLRDMLALGHEAGPNVGVLLDCWHWYTTHGTLDDIRALKAEQVVFVHVNDAPGGIEVDSQVDNVRALPGETGVIDITGFLAALREIGYDGPIVAEPFKKELADLPSDSARLATVSAAVKAILSIGQGS